ncbi:hypothetical protein GOBAR_AA32095 [Gossypium barbadense]|uniref:Uncharacterized protein n=1 Tax=Gossypium barbadense TaxID=3634 RepID=A0A2P5WBW2_GOSBA|nr:hypothetical protein GOBAR_AA32095 [Gossypium barbadense]
MVPEHRHLAAWTCWRLGRHRQPGTSVVREPREHLNLGALDVAGASDTSDTIGKLGSWLCSSLGDHQHLSARICGSLGHHRHLGARMCESLGTIGNLGPWSYGSLGNPRQPRPLVVREPRTPSVPWRLDESRHHRQPRPLVVREPRHHRQPRPLALGHAGASGTIGTLLPRMCGSLEQYWHLGAWMCGSLGHHRQPRTLDVRMPRAAGAPWCLGYSVLYIMENRSENDPTGLTEEINALLERLKFSEEETGQIISA